jgi:hypothetical protein
MDDKIGLIDNQDYINQLCLSIIDDLENNSFFWVGDATGINITINGQTKFIPNESDEEKEITELWNLAKKTK